MLDRYDHTSGLQDTTEIVYHGGIVVASMLSHVFEQQLDVELGVIEVQIVGHLHPISTQKTQGDFPFEIIFTVGAPHFRHALFKGMSLPF
jgi:hypothetical protein